ncbi:transcriptional regulator [Brevibacillus massiliensis]|uniref:transcriptional regulator n=1 Tax=Brevibacillus massiliensis TaxID=1118054 RepID=UPI00031DA628|nr:transcriptional regulator [Brevibacillus massiliensis]
MEIKIAVIGPSDLVHEVLQVAKAFPALKPYPCSYKDVQETQDIVRRWKDQVEVLLFAGPIPYQLALEHVEEHKPMLYLPHNGTSLYRVFFQLVRENRCNHKSERLRFSIDILRREEIEERLDELELDVDEMFVMEYHTGQNTDDILRFHYELWREQKVDAVLTCVTAVYKRLVEWGVPCYRIIPTKSSITDCLQRAELEGKSVYFSDTQLAIGIISVEGFQNRSDSEYDIQRKKLSIQQVLIDYSEETQALMNWSSRDEITFVTTRGVIERTTHNFSRYPLLDQIVYRLQVKASIGIGFGRTANEAEHKAREALAKAKSGGGGNCYLVMQDGHVLGPLGKESQLEYSVRSDDPKRIYLAQQAGLSVATINRLISYCEGCDSYQMTAAELAHGFGIAVRSARRILSTLEQAGLAEVVGEEQPVCKGRPRQIYQLKLNQKMSEGEWNE